MKNKYIDIVGGGDSLNFWNEEYIKKGIGTLNFLVGVPCTIGGAIYMNAGAFNHSISEVIEYVYVFDLDGLKYKVLTSEECMFRYRDSCFKYHNFLIIGARMKLIHKDRETLNKEKNSYLKIRREKLPLEHPNLGSIFKNPPGLYAGKLIEDAGFKGVVYKGIKVSSKHANVIINHDNGTGKQVLTLIKKIKRKIKKTYKINLELEIVKL